MPVQSRSVVDKAVGFGPSDEELDFLLDRRTKKAYLIGQAYLFQGPAGMEFDPALVKEVRVFDPGFRPIHRIMRYKSASGGEILCHNWGICRHSTKQPGEADWKLKLLAEAPNPPKSLRFELGEPRPNLIDAWYPFLGMDEHSLPPKYLPFDRHAVEVLRQMLSEREEAKDHDAHEAWKKAYKATAEQEEKEGDAILKEGMADFGERLENSLTPSTSKVPATPRHLQIKES